MLRIWIIFSKSLQSISKQYLILFIPDDIIAVTGNSNVEVKILDTSSLGSVRKFAQIVLKTENRLDVLCLNAGIGGFDDKRLSPDGIELTMATNHFGHFLLVHLLANLLEKSKPARIVLTASFAHKIAMSFDPLVSEIIFILYPFFDFFDISGPCFWKRMLLFFASLPKI